MSGFYFNLVNDTRKSMMVYMKFWGVIETDLEQVHAFYFIYQIQHFMYNILIFILLETGFM